MPTRRNCTVGSTTGISWTQATWNPIRGCSRVSPGCINCYAEKLAASKKLASGPYQGLTDKNGRWNGTIRFVEEHLKDPLTWQKPKKVFVNSMSDLFHENLSDDQIDRVFAVMAVAGRHTFQVLTKRPERMRTYIRGLGDYGGTGRGFKRLELAANALGWGLSFQGIPLLSWPIPNIWLGVSVEDQQRAEERIPILLDTPAKVRWISAEPLIGPVVLENLGKHWLGPANQRRGMNQGLDWVVVGGESGRDHRAMSLAWLERIAEECTASHVPLWVKQDSGARSGGQGRIRDALWARKEFPR